MASAPVTPHYRERLSVPLIWWVLAVLLAGSGAVAVGFYLGLSWGTGVAVAGLGIAGTVFWSAATLIVVDDQRLHVGRAVIELDYVGGCRALDPAETSERSGPGADARAYLVLRPYLKTAVELTVSDDADPVPYWLVSTRRPNSLAAAVESARAARLSR